MLWTPGNSFMYVENNTQGTPSSATPGVQVTTGASASTKGTPVALTGATFTDSYWITILASGYGDSGTASPGSLDIMVGSAEAASTILIADLLMGNCGSSAAAGNGPKRWDFPLYIPSGTYLWVQAAGARTSTNLWVNVSLYGGTGVPGYQVGTSVTTYGMGTVPDGTSITPGASASEGAWAQVTASTSRDHFALVPSFQTTGDSNFGLRVYFIDIGIGAATERRIDTNYWFATDGGEFMGGPYNSFPTFYTVPSGSRLVMRASNSGTNDATYNGVIHAVS